MSPRFALVVSDALGADAVAARVGELGNRTDGLVSFDHLCIRDDLESPEAFSDACSIASVLWDGCFVLESNVAESLAKGLIHLVDRSPILVSDRMTQELSVLSVSFGCRVAAGTDGDIIVAESADLRSCLESIHANRGSGKDVLVHVPAGEYGVNMAAIAAMSGGTLMIADDMDRESCRLMDDLAARARPRSWI